jgi:hypothetical protein
MILPTLIVLRTEPARRLRTGVAAQRFDLPSLAVRAAPGRVKEGKTVPVQDWRTRSVPSDYRSGAFAGRRWTGLVVVYRRESGRDQRADLKRQVAHPG